MPNSDYWQSGEELYHDKLNRTVGDVYQIHGDLSHTPAPSLPPDVVSAPDAFVIRLTSESSGIYHFDEQQLSTTDLLEDLPGGATEATTGADMIALNKTTKTLAVGETTGAFALAFPIARDSGGLEYVFLPFHDDSGTRDDVGVTPEGTETADTDSWDRESQGSNSGLTTRMTSRVVYNHSGDKKIYGFYRTLKFDADGKLFEMSAETRYEIDAATSC